MTTPLDLDAIEATARAACDDFDRIRTEHEHPVSWALMADVDFSCSDEMPGPIDHFIAAADPQTVLALVERVRELERRSTKREPTWNGRTYGRLVELLGQNGANNYVSFRPSGDDLEARIRELEAGLVEACDGWENERPSSLSGTEWPPTERIAELRTLANPMIRPGG